MDTLLDADALAPASPKAPSHPPVAGEPSPVDDDPDTLVSRTPDARGTFAETPLVYVLVHILDRRFTGTLVVRPESGTTSLLTLREGAVVRVDRPGEADRLGEEAVAAGACTEEQLGSALAISQGEASLLGAELVVHAGVAPEVVRHLILLQTAKRVAALVNLPPGTTYALHLGDRPTTPHEPWAPLDVLLAAVRSWSDRPRIHGTIRYVGTHPLRLHPEANLSELLTLPAERTALETLSRGEVSLETLYRTIGAGLSSLVYVLAVTRQLLSPEDDRPPMGIPPAVVIAPREQPVTESFVRADTLPEFLPVGLPRTTAPYPFEPRAAAPPPADPPPPAAAPPAPSPAVPKSTLVSATSPPRVASAPAPAPAAAVPLPQSTLRTSAAPPQGPAPQTDDAFDPYTAVDAALARHDLKTAEEHAVSATRAAPKDPGCAALFAWVGAHSGEEDALPEAVRSLTRILEDHPKCEPALYYRGMLLKRAGKDKSALRDFVMILYENATHAHALHEVRELRKKRK